ncbi:Protein CBG27591 [Caenorhabditis briggsae]|uniref:Protein CBG27591 n=1 Tax=Caenorhabditis briggsae TaxID=6238 RepID=B6IKG1_CAEBR|nr:Protein CBG27591 [Caenorhabditis briggsae]CAS00391.1 Protein CBG27591 [Caenorhabditis briggsae]
MENPGIPSIEC